MKLVKVHRDSHGRCLRSGHSVLGEIIQFFGRPRYLSTIPLKGSYLFKIAESVISFNFKFFF